MSNIKDLASSDERLTNIVTDVMVEAARMTFDERDRLMHYAPDADELRAALSAALNAAWVPCSKQMPPDGKEVLGWPIDGDIAVVVRKPWIHVDNTRIGDVWLDGRDYNYLDAGVVPTHWMPLPPTPAPKS